MEDFKKESGKVIYDVKEYILDILKNNKDTKIHIGTDSQKRKGKWIHFATVISFRYGTRGAHYIYAFRKEVMFKTVVQRLMREIELTVDLYLWLKDVVGITANVLEADVNEDKKWKSNLVYNAATGWLMGVSAPETEVLAKPDLLVAVRAANHLCNR